MLKVDYMYWWVFSVLYLQVTAVELYGNYKLWKSVGDGIIYDSTGNLNHGRFDAESRIYYTDRGLMLNNYIVIQFPTNDFKTSPGLNQMSISYWYLRSSTETGARYFGLVNPGANYKVVMRTYPDKSQFDIVKNSVIMSSAEFSLISGWNMYSCFLTQITNSQDVNMKLYINFALAHEYDSISLSMKSSTFYWKISGKDLPMFGILHEVWWHTGLESISEIQSLITYLYGSYCLNSSGALCLPTYDSTHNIHGVACPNSCTNNSLSCDSDLNCIYSFNSSCEYGLYDRKSNECVFYCPENSCKCLISTVDNKNSLSCECKDGFIKVSENPLACISSSCSLYHRENYRYECDQCSSEIRQGCNGDCCECEEGYKMGLEGKCNSCNSGYFQVKEDPILCIEEVKNCISYIQLESSWECQVCTTGYKLDTGKCQECDEGFISIGLDTLVCILEINQCIEYDTSISTVCIVCDTGYSLGLDNKCNECEAGYVRLEEDLLTCTKELPHCLDYEYLEFEYLCKICEVGYFLDFNMKCSLFSEESDCDECIVCPETYKDCTQEHSSCEVCQRIQSEVPEEEYDEMINESSSAAVRSVMAATAIGSIVSLDPNVFISYVNTIKLLSFLIYLKVSVPSKILSMQKSSSNSMKEFNLFQYIKIEGKDLNDGMDLYMKDKYSYILNTCYETLGLILILILNFIFYLLNRFGRGNVKLIASKILKHFKFDIYIQYFKMVYLEVAASALETLVNPKDANLLFILDFNLAILSVVICSLSPILLASFFILNKHILNEDSFKLHYGYLVKNIKETLRSSYFHVIFLIRRLSIAISVNILQNPYSQTILCSTSCILVFIHLIVCRPFKDNVINIIFILIELNVAACYTCTVFLLSSDIYQDIMTWVMLVCICLSYLSHSILGFYKLGRPLYAFIRSYLNRGIQNIKTDQTYHI